MPSNVSPPASPGLRIAVTHMSADMLARAAEGTLAFETARDGLTIQLLTQASN